MNGKLKDYVKQMGFRYKGHADRKIVPHAALTAGLMFFVGAALHNRYASRPTDGCTEEIAEAWESDGYRKLMSIKNSINLSDPNTVSQEELDWLKRLDRKELVATLYAEAANPNSPFDFNELQEMGRFIDVNQPSDKDCILLRRAVAPVGEALKAFYTGVGGPQGD